jgi:hypothetical protein
MKQMNFQTLKQSIIDNVLVPGEQGRYITIGHQRQRKSAEVINANRQVTLYYSEGDFPDGQSKSYGDVIHKPTFLIELAVATEAEVDLATLNDDTATENDKAKVLRAMSEAGVSADKQMDELIAIVWNVLMDARNEQMGINPPGDRPDLKVVASRKVDQIRKDTPSQDGEFFVLTASMRLTCNIEENIDGADLGIPGNKVFDADITLEGDDTAKQGVEQLTP